MSNVNKFKTQHISVYVRLRPFIENEDRSNVIQVVNSKEVIVAANNQKKFSFDGVFGVDCKQISLYRTIVQPLISEILSGYNCTVFAYGQTGTGKTFTMTEGTTYTQSFSSVENVCQSPSSAQDAYVLDEKSGIVPRVLTELFKELHDLQQQYAVRCSYLEIYNEDLRDLLSGNEDFSSLRIYDDQRNKGGVFVNGIEEVTVHNTFDAMKLVQKGQDKRRTASTQINDRSSRSHTIFTIIVHTREIGKDGEELVKMGKINLVDLAGSENINKSGAVDQRAREAGNINQSLLTLGRVIKALSEKKGHIPFRESKLTRILQDSLGGKTKTSIIATISPCTINLDETLSTLDYAYRARGITNKPETNQRISQKKLISQYVDEINRLRKDLHAARTGQGVILDSENYNQLLTEQKIKTAELSKNILLRQDLENKLKLLEEEKKFQEDKWIKTCVAFEDTRVELEKIKIMYEKTEMEKKEQEYLAQKYQANAEHLHQEAKGLLSIVKSSSSNEMILGNKVAKLYEITTANSEVIRRSCVNMEDTCNVLHGDVMDFTKSSAEYHKKMDDATGSILQQILEKNRKLESLKSTINSIDSDINDLLDDLLKENQNNIMDGLKQCMELTTASQEWSIKEVQSLLQLVLCHEEKRKDDVSKLTEPLSAISNVLSQSQSDVISNLRKTQDYFLKELDLTEDLQMQSQSTDLTLSEVGKFQEELSETIMLKWHETQKELEELRSINLECMSLIEKSQDNLATRIFEFKKKLDDFVEKFISSFFEAKFLMQERIRENFNVMTEAIKTYSNNEFITQINNTHNEVQRILYEEFDTIEKNVSEPSVQLLLLFSNMKSYDDDISRQMEDFSQHSEQYNSNIGVQLAELESQTECLAQNNVGIQKNGKSTDNLR